MPQVPVIQLFSVYVGSHRLRGACRRAATVFGDVSFSVMRFVPRASGYQWTSSTCTSRFLCFFSSSFIDARKKSR